MRTIAFRAGAAAALAAATLACGAGTPSGGDADAETPGEDVDGETSADDRAAAEDARADRDAPDLDDGAGEAEGGGEDAAEDAADADAQDDGDGADDADAAPRIVTCADDPPPDADLPDALPVYGATCPTLVAGSNTIVSSGNTRAFLLVVPADLDPAERLPLVFLWHWLGGDAAGFLTDGDVQEGADAARFLAAIPEAKGDLALKWPYLIVDTEARIEEEARFFDDMLACIAEQYAVNASCVSTIGVSAGGLWTPQLAQRRARRLAGFASLSGGVGQPGDWLNPVRPWAAAAHRMPAIVLWGGPTDFCGISFAASSEHLEDALEADGHFILECVHNCSHAEPPMEPPPGESKYVALWSFAGDHPYWLRDGESPYQATGVPANLPAWCGIGRGGAVPRTGSCEGGILGDCL